MAKSGGRGKRPRRAPASVKQPAVGTDDPGMPDPASIVEERTFVSPKGRRYTILRTDQMDPYDVPQPPRRKRPSAPSRKRAT
jgi:hypothetical protein